MKYVLGFDIGGTKSAVLLASPDKEHVVFLERKSIPTHGTWKEVLGCLADMGYADARNVLAVSGRYFGRGLAMLVDILNPERIVAGGIYARAGRFLKEEMEKELRREALPANVNACCILPSGLGEQIGDYGAVMAAMEIWEE